MFDIACLTLFLLSEAWTRELNGEPPEQANAELPRGDGDIYHER